MSDHLRAVDRCYPRSEIEIARVYAAARIAEDERRTAHAAEIDALVLPCPLGSDCASFAGYMQRDVPLVPTRAAQIINLRRSA